MFNHDNIKSNTYYLTDFSNTMNKTPYIKDIYNKEVGYYGDQLISNPYLSDNTKLGLISIAKPEYKENINKFKKIIPLMQKTQQFSNNYLTSKNKDIDFENDYKLHSNIINSGGKYKTKKNRKNRKGRNNKRYKKYTNKMRKYKYN